jgi:hypothetical protein
MDMIDPLRDQGTQLIDTAIDTAVTAAELVIARRDHQSVASPDRASGIPLRWTCTGWLRVQPQLTGDADDLGFVVAGLP